MALEIMSNSKNKGKQVPNIGTIECYGKPNKQRVRWCIVIACVCLGKPNKQCLCIVIACVCYGKPNKQKVRWCIVVACVCLGTKWIPK